MRHVNPASKRGSGVGPTYLRRNWSLRDFVSFCAFASLLIFFVIVYTSLSDSRRTTPAPASSSDRKQRDWILTILDDDFELKSGAVGVERKASGTVVIDACSAAEVDQMPCEDPRRNSQLSRYMNFYRERHCPVPEEMPLCLIPPPAGYRIPVPWPESLHKIWHSNMPHNKIADRKGHQGWMKEDGEYFLFPGGGTMFPEGAVKYITKLGLYIPMKNGALRTALDMGCGVASFGGYLLKEDILTLSFAPRDSHKSQIQFALERGIPAFVAMLGTRRLPFPVSSFDLIHCSRCLIPFTAYNATYFTEVDRLLRPGGYLVISGPPVRWPKQDKEWADLQSVARALCYDLIIIDGNTVIWRKPSKDSCLPNQNEFGLVHCNDDPTEAWYFNLKNCISKLSDSGEISLSSIPNWPHRLTEPPPRVSLLKNGAGMFQADSQDWIGRVTYYKHNLGIKLGTFAIRNVMDMNAFLGGFAAALLKDSVWVMNVVPAHKMLTLGVIYDRGLVGVYHDWCEPFSTYPRTYDLINVNGIATLIKYPSSNETRCNLVDLMVEMDRILRPEGMAIIRDAPEVIDKVGRIAHAIRWAVSIHEPEPESRSGEKILLATKQFWKVSASS